MSVRLQKADFWKRISAYMLDILIIFIIAVASTLLFMTAFKYDSYLSAIENKRAEYELEYGIDFGNFDNISVEFSDVTKIKNGTQKRFYKAFYGLFSLCFNHNGSIGSTHLIIGPGCGTIITPGNKHVCVVGTYAEG